MRNLTTLVVLGSVQWALASAEFFVVESDPEWTDDGRSYRFVMRDGSAAPEGLRVQGLSGVVTGAFPAPLPLAPGTLVKQEQTHAYGMHTPEHIRESMMGLVVMGRDAANQGYPAGPGCVSAFIEGDDDWYGTLRAFSAPSIGAAAYYGDTELRMLEELGEFNDTWSQLTFPITNVNPAYTGLCFDIFPVLTGQGSITGSVNTTEKGGNNQLDNSMVRVAYSSDEGATWHVLHELTIKGDGDFSGRYEATGLPLVRVEGISARPGLPNSGPGVIPIPEPAAGLGLCTMVWWGRRQAARRAA